MRPRPTAKRADGVVIAALATALCLMLGQRSLYYTDGHYLLESLRDASLASDRHALARPLFTLWQHVLGLPAHLAVTSCGAISAGVAVFFTHAIGRLLGLDRSRAALAAILVATADPVVFFGTVVEYHGPFLGFAACTLWLAVSAAAGRRVVLAIATGVAGAIAAHVHLSGVALVGGAVVWTATLTPAHRVGARHALLLAGVALATQVIVFLGIAARAIELGWWSTGSWTSTGVSVGVAVEFMCAQSLSAPFQAWKEWLVPFFPLSVVPILALLRRGHQLEALGVIALVAFWSWMCAANLIVDPEYGAYLTALAVPVGVLAARSLPRAACVGLALANLWFALDHVARHDTRGADYESWTAQVSAATAPNQPFPIVIRGRGPRALDELPAGAVDEIAACLVTAPNIRYFDLGDLARAEPAAVAPALRLLPALLRDRAGTAHALVSRHVIAQLGDGERLPSGPMILAALREDFRFDPAPAGFDGFLVREL